MKKTAFVVTALLPALALADINLYGTIRSGLSVSQTQIGNTHFNRSSVDDLGSYIGIRGNHPIGSSNMIWQFEQNTPIGQNGSLREHFRNRKERNGDSGWFVGISD
ncbi:hypothetical protein PL75_05915 [Neisseria arctica]|uniref:Porin domain-containing protein n=1 Tax=Neisseria arctica TaxID=1470200 RepID=A0A0J0YRW0_9NEIS|nr:hypothetical protein [Neisseria arctica]KLT72832.1 hypothetical protein PL75_05915 [Neisseria arctica]UOO86544.1 hypothetical protein LVJ86_10205 [Neisseria arctica]